MDLWQLKIFVSVVDHKSFSKASQTINLSQPTVSSHIKELEDQFECKLLDRLGKTTEPTKAGRILYRHAEELLRMKDRTESALHDFLGNTKGSLVIGGSTIPSGYIIPKLIGPFSRVYPDIHIRLIAGDTMQIAQKIKTGEIEAGIIGAQINDPDIRQEKLIPDDLKLVVPKDHPMAQKKKIDCKALFNEPIIAREKGSGTWKAILNGLEREGFDPGNLNIAVTMGNTVSVIQGIINHIGISILSTIAVQDDLNRKRLHALPIDGLSLDRYFYLTLHKKRTSSPLCEKFAAFTRQFFSDKTD